LIVVLAPTGVAGCPDVWCRVARLDNHAHTLTVFVVALGRRQNEDVAHASVLPTALPTKGVERIYRDLLYNEHDSFDVTLVRWEHEM
jgi:hypothetical protein